MDFTADIRSILGTHGDAVTLASGAVIRAFPGVASADDSMVGDAIVAGKTRTLRGATSDLSTVVPGQALTWSAKSYRVVAIQLFAMGQCTRLFLGSAT